MLYARTYHHSEFSEQSFVPDPRSFQLNSDPLAKPVREKSHPDNTKSRPMLAIDVDINNIKGRVLVQPKLDGVRAIWNPNTGQLHTRNGNIITSCEHIIEAIFANQLENHHLDGEIYTDDLPFQVINAKVRKHQPDQDTLKLQYHIFDLIDDNLTADKRAEWLAHITPSQVIKPVATFYATQSDIKDYYQCFLDSGLEGIIIREPKARYRHGRTEQLGRVKPVQDMEATLVGFSPTTSVSNRNTFGSLILRLSNGKTFKCASFTPTQRKKLWQQKPIGASITVLFKGLTIKGLPREPRFKAIRYDIIEGAA